MKHSNLEFQRVDTLPALTANSVIWIDKPDADGDVAIWEHVAEPKTALLPGQQVAALFVCV